MDGRSFDNLLRSLTKSRRSLVGSALTAGGILAGLTSAEAKKKKKKCAKKCKDGCCTKKYGKCIRPAQQSSTRCGSGGEICRTNCEGPVCDEDCIGCCDGPTCIEDTSDAQCGGGGAACFPCGADQSCTGLACCGKLGRTCSADEPCCLTGKLACESGKCCVNNDGPCTKSSDCCPLGSEQICDNGTCVIPTGLACQPGWMCQGDTLCPGSGICGGPNDCTQACAEFGQCVTETCFGDLLCCTPEDVDTCNVPEFICECLVEGGHCTRIVSG